MTPALPSTQTTRHASGALSVGDRAAVPCRITLERDPFAPNDMRAEVHGLPSDQGLDAEDATFRSDDRRSRSPSI